MIALLKEIGEERLDAMTTEDYLLLGALYRAEDMRNVAPEQFSHLEELGIVKYSEYGISPANAGVILAIGTLSELGSDKVPINGFNKEQAIIDYMAERDYVTTAELAELLSVSQRSVLKLFKKLEDKGFKVVKSGGNRDAKYKLEKI
jgi:DNA-binding MarR family transcriptional regulator